MGIALLRKTWRRRPGLPAILLTGHLEDTDPTLEERPGDGKLALLHKPVTAREVNAQIATLLA